MNNKKINEPFNLPTIDDFFENTHGNYIIGCIEKINFEEHISQPNNFIDEQRCED